MELILSNIMLSKFYVLLHVKPFFFFVVTVDLLDGFRKKAMFNNLSLPCRP